MYLRNVKQFIKNASPAFDERKCGFPSFMDAVRAAQRAGILRLDRNRQGILRVYPGSLIQTPPPVPPPLSEPMRAEESTMEEPVLVEVEPIIEAAAVEEVIDVSSEPVIAEVAAEEQPFAEEEKPVHKKRVSAGTAARKKSATSKPRTAAAKRSRKKPVSEEAPA
jgi:hypothetical protein